MLRHMNNLPRAWLRECSTEVARRLEVRCEDVVTRTTGVKVTVPSSPAFWDADGVPASPEQRGRIKVAGKYVTTLLVRRRPTSEPEQPYRIVLPVECPVAQLC